ILYIMSTISEEQLQIIKQIRQDIIALSVEINGNIMFENFLCYEILDKLNMNPKFGIGYQVFDDKYQNNIWIDVKEKGFHFNTLPYYYPGMEVYWTEEKPKKKKPVALISDTISMEEERELLE